MKAIASTATHRQVGFGVLGCGLIGEVHCRAIEAAPSARLAAVLCDRQPFVDGLEGRKTVELLTEVYRLAGYDTSRAAPRQIARPGLRGRTYGRPAGYYRARQTVSK